MSGIAGFYWLDGRRIDEEQLRRMILSMPHRCPDGTGLWKGLSVGLAHGSLASTPESVGDTQPLVSKDGWFTLVADVRLDNREELIDSLGIPARPSPSDAEVLLAAYQRWGRGAVPRLLGDFAFCIWDAREQMLLCARDHFGVKPFTYYAGGSFFAFCSEIKGLFASGKISATINDVRVADYLSSVLEDKESTFFEGVRRLPPGHLLTCSPHQGVKVEPYWDIESAPPFRLRSDGEYEEAFRHVFREAVRCRLRSLSGVGAFLSGGLDSSGIAAVANGILRAERRGPLEVFSALFDQVPESDERSFARQALAEGMVPHELKADRLSPLADLDELMFHFDEPFYAPNLFMHWALFRAAKKSGVRVMLDGIDGDTTVCHATSRLTELARSGRVPSFVKEAALFAKRHGLPLKKVLWAKGGRPHLLAALRPVRPLKFYGVLGHQPILHPELERRTAYLQRARRLRAGRWNPPLSVREEHARLLTGGIIPLILEAADKTAAASSIEARYPFFDKRLVELCFRLPPRMKFRSGWTRFVERKAFLGILPDSICWRAGKSDLSPNFVRSLLLHEGENLRRMVAGKFEVLEPYVAVDALNAVYRRCVERKSAEDAMGLWKALTLALWLENINGNSSAAAASQPGVLAGSH